MVSRPPPFLGSADAPSAFFHALFIVELLSKKYKIWYNGSIFEDEVPKMTTWIPVALAAVLAVVALAFLWQERQREIRLRLRVQKFYASELFEDMAPFLKAARLSRIEQLTVDKTGIILRRLGQETDSAFLMRPNGYAYLSQEQQEALRAVLEECLPKLRDNRRYHVSRRRVRLLNGTVEYGYRYTMRNDYKAALNRAAYYESSLKARSW